MPRVSNQLLECAVYLYRTKEEADAGRHVGGSGFLLGIPLDAAEPITPPPATPNKGAQLDAFEDLWQRGEPFLYVVTNWHVIESGNIVVRFNTTDGKHDVRQLSSWKVHKSADLAVHLVPWATLIGNGSHRCVPYEYIMTPENLLPLDIGIGDDVVSIGRFINHEGQQRNRPMARFGNIAIMPAEDEPVKVVYEFEMEIEGKGKSKNTIQRPQVSLLVESRTIPGYSGSPVFLWVPSWELRESPEGTLRKALYTNLSDAGLPYVLARLLGITWGYLLGRNQKGFKIGKHAISGVSHPSNSGMMGAVPAWKLLEVLNEIDLVQERATIRAQVTESPKGIGC